MSSRGWAALTLAVLLLALGLAAVRLVPWHAPDAPRADQLAALAGMPADRVQRGRAFHAALRPPGYAGMAVGILVPLLLGLTPLGARLAGWAARPTGGHWLGQALLGGLLVLLLVAVAELPFAVWRAVVLRRYGLSTQGWGAWAVDQLKGYAIGGVLAALVLAGFYTVTRLAPRWWWTFAAAGAAALVVLFTFVFPVLVEPVFNRFTPMPAGPLRDDLVAMAARDGVPVRDVLVADASRRTTALNAYVSGLGPTRRIVVYDTLLREAPPEEVRNVVAHELGHARDRDVTTGTLLGAFAAAASVVAVYLLGQWGGLLRRAGVEAIGTPRAFALLLALVALAGLVLAPAQNLVSRRIEARADGHALGLTRDPAGFAAMQRRLALVNLSDVDPPRAEYLLFATHPSTVERIATAAAWAARHPAGR
jgi:STE24 endopeptidase